MKLKNIIKKIPFSIFIYSLIIFLVKNIKNYPKNLMDFFVFKTKSKNIREFKAKWSDRKFYTQDNTKETYFEPHYTYHPAWAARIVKKINPTYHIDISSTLQFSAILSAFIKVKFYDYRPASLKLSNLSSEKADLLSLPFENDSIKSLSCMHTVEHIGLGRYGDKIGPDDDLKGISELKRVLSKGGSLLFVVPIGKPKIAFNAHRIYSYDQITTYFSDLELKEFSLIPDSAINTGIITNASKELSDDQDWGCGCFWFIKK